ncbi:MAG: hypothetical protein AAF747_09690 [Planctomycetota bacterium]
MPMLPAPITAACVKAFALASVAWLASSSLGQLTGPDQTPVAEFRFVDPLTTDPGIVDVELPNAGDLDRDHVVATSRAEEPNGRLFVWISGSGATPGQYLEVTRTAAEQGYDAVGVVYASWPPVNDITTQNPDTELPELIRRERIFGEPFPGGSGVDPANGIENRLIKLLQHQASAFPNERWTDYLTPTGGVDWSRIVVAGHSQGAGHSAYLGKIRRVAGVLIFGGPGDFVQGFGTAPWVIEPGITPPGRSLAFVHLDDATAPGFFFNQRILGLNAFGDLQGVDRRPASELTSHMLTSGFPVPPGQTGHSAVCVDGRMPLNADGSPRYEPVWAYMLTDIPCTADIDADGSLDASDVSDAVNEVANALPQADWNGDASVDYFDIATYLQRLRACESL